MPTRWLSSFLIAFAATPVVAVLKSMWDAPLTRVASGTRAFADIGRESFVGEMWTGEDVVVERMREGRCGAEIVRSSGVRIR